MIIIYRNFFSFLPGVVKERGHVGDRFEVRDVVDCSLIVSVVVVSRALHHGQVSSDFTLAWFKLSKSTFILTSTAAFGEVSGNLNRWFIGLILLSPVPLDLFDNLDPGLSF